MTTATTAVDATESRAGMVVAAVSALLAITTTLVGLRIYTRMALLKTIGLDDWAVVVALLLTITCGITIAANTVNGLGRHVSSLKPAEITNYLEAFYLSIVFYNAALMAVKISFLLQYHRVFTVRYMRRIFLVALAVIGCWCMSQLLVAIFNCQPIAGFWDQSLNAKCIPNLPFWYINAAGNIATDIAIVVLPLPVIGGLKLAKGQKVILVGIFCLGFFTTAISILRIQYLKLAEDFTYENVDPAIWSVAEPCCGVICACLPTLRPLVAKYIPALSSRGGQSSTLAPYPRYGAGRSTGSSANGRDVSKEGLYKPDLGSDEPGVATVIVAGRQESKLRTVVSGREIQIKQEVRIVEDKHVQV